MSIVNDRIMFFKEALKLSQKKVSTESLVSKIEEKAGEKLPRLGKNIDTVSKWVGKVVTRLCINIPTVILKTPKFRARERYLFIVLFTCIRKLMQLYLVNNIDLVKTRKYTDKLQLIGVVALLLAYKALVLGEYIGTCDTYVSISTLSRICRGSCPEKEIRSMERELWLLTGFTPCSEERITMIRNLERRGFIKPPLITQRRLLSRAQRKRMRKKEIKMVKMEKRLRKERARGKLLTKIVKVTGRRPSFYKEWSVRDLEQRLEALRDEQQ